jgi:isoleucyl-tRNA synthetase
MKLRNEYYILRHGQTIYQTKKKEIIYPSSLQNKIGLTKEGRRQIINSAKKLKKIGIDLIYSSDFYRARESAKIVAKELGIKKINFDKRLRDVNLGVYHGRKKEAFYRDFPGVTHFRKRPLGGESWQDVLKRVIAFIKEIDRKYQGKKILIVSHGDPLWLLENWVKKLKFYDLDKSLKLNYIQTGELRKL